MVFSVENSKEVIMSFLDIRLFQRHIHSLIKYSKHSFILSELDAYIKCVNHDIKIKT